MQNYEELIMELLGEGTTKEKYERLKRMIEFLEALAYPRRGTWDEYMTIETAAEHSVKILNELKPNN